MNYEIDRDWYIRSHQKQSVPRIDTYESDVADYIEYLYNKITGSDKAVGFGFSIGKKELFKMCLLHYGYMSGRHWGMLFGKEQMSNISIYANRCNRNTLSEGKAVSATVTPKGVRMYYLTAAEYSAQSAFLDLDYSEDRCFPRAAYKSGSLGSHAVAVLDTVYGLLADRDLLPFRYFNYVVLDLDEKMSLARAIEKRCCNFDEDPDDVIDGGQTDVIVPDSVFSFAGRGNIFLELDMLTETYKRLEEKMLSYGEYFGRRTDEAVRNCVMMNFDYQVSEAESGVRKRGDGAHFKAALANIKQYFSFDDARSVQDAYIYYCNMLEKNPRSRSPRSVLKLIENCSRDIGLSIVLLSRELLYDYADRVILEQDMEAMAKVSQKKRQRATKAKDIFDRLVSTRENVALRKSVAAGISFTFTIAEDITHGSGYIFLQQSDVPEKMLREGIPFLGKRTEEKWKFGSRIVSDGNQHFLLRNATDIPSDKNTVAAFEEVSADRAARYRMTNLLRKYGSGDELITLVLLVSDKEDAVAFCSDVKMFSMIADGENPMKQDRGVRLRCCFYDYVMRDGYFMPDENGRIHYFTILAQGDTLIQ